MFPVPDPAAAAHYYTTVLGFRAVSSLEAAGALVVKPLTRADYRNDEFVVADPNGRWLASGLKTD